MNVKLSMKEYELNPLHYVSLPGYSFDCWLMSSGVTLDTIQDKQILDDFVGAKRGGICGIMGDRYINTNANFNANDNVNANADVNANANANSKNRTIREPASQIWYRDANNLFGYAMMQKLSDEDFKYCDTSLVSILNTPVDSDNVYSIVCDINYTNSCKDRIEQLALMPNKRKINDND